MPSLSLLSLALIIGLTASKPITDAAFTQSVRQSLRTGDAHQLSMRFAKSVQLIIDVDQINRTSVTASEGEQLLRAFFRKYPPQGFQFTYQGAADRLRYSTGTYETSGQSFAVYVLMRQTDDQQFAINALHVRRQ